MIYPNFLKEGDTIGICAPSSGIDKDDLRFDVSLDNLKKKYNVFETQNVRTGLSPSSDAKTRGEEFNSLMSDDNISFIYSASGGDFLMETLPYIDNELIERKIAENKTKWFAGYSDPTSLLYYLTTRFDIATLYGTNAGSFDQIDLHPCLQNALDIIGGNIPKQNSFEMHERRPEGYEKNNGANSYLLNTKTKWVTPNGDVDIEGRLIGGCIDCFVFFSGTKYDYTKDFIERYKDDGIIWYFDNFALCAEDLFSELWTLKESGWFKYAKGFVFGRTLFESTRDILTYEEAIKRALGSTVPIITEADIGHVKPTFTLINGSIAHFKSSNGKGSLEMKLL